MSDDEPIAVLDAAGAPTGEVKPRAAVHRDGDWHAAFHLWVLSGDEVLLQRRSERKASWPGHLDATAAGHLLAGEAVLDGLREAEEELGVAYAADAVTPLGRWTIDEPRPVGRNREVQHVFAVRDERALDAWTGLDRVEVDGLVAMALSGFAELAGGVATGPWPGRAWDGERVRPTRVSRDEVVPTPYFAQLAAALRALG